MQYRFIFSRSFIQAFVNIALLAIAGFTPQLHAAEAVVSEPQSATLLNSVYYELTSAITGRDYRIFVSAPADAGPDKAYPVLYLLDANRDFQMAANFARGIIVGIGYQLQDMSQFSVRRALDLSPTVDPSRPVPTGDSGNFLRMLEEEVRPFIEARYNLAADDQTLYGHSLGGLAVLGHMFAKPEAYNTFIIGSPAVGWDNHVVLTGEAAFAERIKTGDFGLRVLLTSASNETSCDICSVDDASALAERLQALNPDKLQITRVVFEGESHNSSVRASLGRALYFVMPE